MLSILTDQYAELTTYRSKCEDLHGIGKLPDYVLTRIPSKTLFPPMSFSPRSFGMVVKA